MKKRKVKVKRKIKRQQKSITLGYDADNPSVTIVPGHVGPVAFTQAYKAEGWNGFGRIRKEEIFHVYLKKLKRTYKKVDKEAKGAKPYTALYW